MENILTLFALETLYCSYILFPLRSKSNKIAYLSKQVILKNLPPSSSLIEEIMDRVKSFLVNKALLKGDSVTASRPFRHLRGESVRLRSL